jgi:hypothetical protein
MKAKFDADNYRKHGSIYLNGDRFEYFKKNNERVDFTASNLVFFWHRIDSSNLAKDAIVSGRIRVKEKTPLGAKKPALFDLDIAPSQQSNFVQFLYYPVDFAYTIEALNHENVSRSIIEIWEFLPSITTSIYPMSGQFNPSGTDPALAAAMQAVVTASQASAAASAATTAAVVASDENNLNYDNIVSEFVLPNTTVFNSQNNQNRVLAADRNCREIIIANNNLSGSVKITSEPPADNTPYAAIISIGNPIAPGGQIVLNDPTCRDNIFAVGSVNGLKLSVTRSVRVTTPSV